MFGIGKEKSERELGAAVDSLLAADTLAFAGVGIAGTLLPVTEAYERVSAALDDHPEEVRRQLDRVLADGTPAGRVYAATLLERVDPAAARAAWTSLRDDPSEFTTFVGCVMDRETLGTYASRRLATA
ncbi:hypothetical protein [Micromonospora sp. CPCC 205558]|uniref:hypothetical protein n=1 Tax=Micromonospora sp. CPCC 205558 TaxID=3122403 RepID=UPI002FF070FF